MVKGSDMPELLMIVGWKKPMVLLPMTMKKRITHRCSVLPDTSPINVRSPIASALLGQLSKYRGGFFEVARIEAFSEAAVDRREQVASCATLALIAPETG